MADLANARASVFDHRPGVATLRRVIDFDRLNEAKVPLIVTAIEAQSGRQVRFDARTHRLAPEHLLATTAMPPLFPPIEIEGRSLADPGLVENLPLDPVLDPPLDTDLVCLAVDAYAPNGEALHDLDTAAERAQDIVFASQSWRALRGHLERHRLRRIVGSLLETRDRGDDRARAPEAARREASAAQLTVVRIAYRAPAYEVAGKALDYSRWSLAERWSAGHDDMQRALTRLETETGACRGDGYALYDGGNDRTDSPVVR
jgi:NTE family protein